MRRIRMASIAMSIASEAEVEARGARDPEDGGSSAGRWSDGVTIFFLENRRRSLEFSSLLVLLLLLPLPLQLRSARSRRQP
jgi:hypothetical protein